MFRTKFSPLWGVLGLFLLVGTSHAILQVEEAPISAVGEAATVSVSTTSWTQMSSVSGSKLERRSGVDISNPSASNASIACVKSSGTPSEATTIRPHELEAGEDKPFYVGNAVDVYCLSLHTSAESMHVQEFRQ